MRKKIRGARPERTTVLLLTNGEITEDQYLGLVKQAIHARHGRSYAVTVKKEAGASPLELYRKTQSPHGDLNSFDQVWLVVDKDDFPLEDFLKSCIEKHAYRNRRAKDSGQRCFFAVVSNPCFEVLLVSHFERVRAYQNQADAKRHYEAVAGLQKDEKQLPATIALDDLEGVCDNTRLRGAPLLGLNEEGKPPGTAMPYLFEYYGLVEL